MTKQGRIIQVTNLFIFYIMIRLKAKNLEDKQNDHIRHQFTQVTTLSKYLSDFLSGSVFN